MQPFFWSQSTPKRIKTPNLSPRSCQAKTFPYLKLIFWECTILDLAGWNGLLLQSSSIMMFIRISAESRAADRSNQPNPKSYTPRKLALDKENF